MEARRPEDLIAVRAASRAIAAGLGLDETDQVRLATALSEVGRDVLAADAEGEVVFGLADAPVPAVTVTFVLGPSRPDLARAPGVAAARRLVDNVRLLDDGTRRTVALVKTVAARSTTIDRDRLAAAVRAAVPPSPVDELLNQNRQLATALAEV